MNQPPDAGTSTPAEALSKAAEAITRLEKSTSTRREASPWSTAAVAAVCVLAFAGIVVHTFYESEAPKVDDTSALLLAVLLFAPFVRYLRALEFAGAKAEFQDNASTGLSAVLEVVTAEHEAILKIWDELLAQSAPEAEAEPADQPAPAPAERRPAAEVRPAPRLLRRILWVDDKPEGNAYELDALRKLFDVDTARTTQEAEPLLRQGAYNGVISDIVRDEAGKQGDPEAGARILALSRELHLPVFFYSSYRAIRGEGQRLMDAGAVVVTASYVELVRAIRLRARESFDEVVRGVLHQLPGVEVDEQVDDIDYLVTLADGHRLAVETPHWLGPRTPGGSLSRPGTPSSPRRSATARSTAPCSSR
jgi:hypothetical protein